MLTTENFEKSQEKLDKRGKLGRGTVPAISFKSDILAAKVNITNMDNEAFFNILDIPFEL